MAIRGNVLVHSHSKTVKYVQLELTDKVEQ